MATRNAETTGDQAAQGKERSAKAKSEKGQAKDDSAKAKEQTFVWTDDEVELLLKVTHEYKVKKAAENVDWESVRSKYANIWDNLRKELPASPEEGRDLGKDYPHAKEEINKASCDEQVESCSAEVQAGCG